MALTKNQFNILAYLEGQQDKISTQRNIANNCALSIGTVNKTLLQLNEEHFIEGNRITSAGKSSLEPYRVKRAVFIAAGFGSRLVPITLNTPKPLVRVKGVRIIDTLLDAVCAIGITDIIIVRG
jgi:DNA-binding transcriptional MocR family regulator